MSIAKLYHHLTSKPANDSLFSYGVDKSAAEMVFSYGFIEENRITASSITLILRDFNSSEEDVVYNRAKRQLVGQTPRLVITSVAEDVTWSSEFIW